MGKTDDALALLIGFFAGLFAIPTAYALGSREPGVLLALPWIGAAAIFFGVWLGGALGAKIPVFRQFAKFVAVGVLNTAIDFGVLNILSITTGVVAGFVVGGVNVPGFGVAVINSYLWNKLWVFRNREVGEPLFADFIKFFGITIAGVTINSGLIILLTTYAPILATAGAAARLNVAKAAATAVTLVWNFIGYKFVVFAKAFSQPPAS